MCPIGIVLCKIDNSWIQSKLLESVGKSWIYLKDKNKKSLLMMVLKQEVTGYLDYAKRLLFGIHSYNDMYKHM